MWRGSARLQGVEDLSWIEQPRSVLHLSVTLVSEEIHVFLQDFDFAVLVKHWFGFVSSSHYLWLK